MNRLCHFLVTWCDQFMQAYCLACGWKLRGLNLELLSSFPITRQLCDPEGGNMQPHLSGTFPEQAA